MSSNKTEHLQLHQWESGDRFDREEFNENFAKIDEDLTNAKNSVSQTLNAYQGLIANAMADGLAAQSAALSSYKTANDAVVAQAVKRVKLKEISLTTDVKNVMLDLTEMNLGAYRRLEVDLALKSNVGADVYLYYNQWDGESTAYTYTSEFRTAQGSAAAYLYVPCEWQALFHWDVEVLDGGIYSRVQAFPALPVVCMARLGALTGLGLQVTGPGNGTLTAGCKISVWGIK